MSPLDSCPFHAPVTMFNDAVIAMRTGLVSVPLTSLCVPQRVKPLLSTRHCTPAPPRCLLRDSLSNVCTNIFRAKQQSPKRLWPTQVRGAPCKGDRGDSEEWTGTDAQGYITQGSPRAVFREVTRKSEIQWCWPWGVVHSTEGPGCDGEEGQE